MSGHSKWSKVKHQKATTDAVKSYAFTKASHAITIAVKEGGGVTDPEKNFRLRLAIDFAHTVNMPKENIHRAIGRAVVGSELTLESVTYEGFGPGGVAYILYGTTDNRNRTAAQIKQAFEHAGGTLAAPHAVEYLFERGEDGVLRSRYPQTIPSDLIVKNKELLDALHAIRDIEYVVTSMR